jgi:collagenase-like PrtC family protease
MNYFSVPADFKNETIDRYFDLNRSYNNSKVLETYGQITVDNCLGSGRSYNLLPKMDIHKLESYVNYSKSKGIDFNYTMNASCLDNKEYTKTGLLEIGKFLDVLYSIGIRGLTVALPSLVEFIKSTKYDFEIKTSTVCSITNANKALSHKKLGVDRIVPEESVNRDFMNLKEIRKVFGEKVEVIVNVVCHKNCIYRMFHHNQMSHDFSENSQQTSMDYYSHRCMMKRAEEASNLLKLGWIRPEDIKYYTDIGIRYFKIQGRQAVLKGDVVRTVECYFKESYDGNLFELLDVFAPTNAFMISVDNRKLDGFIEPFYKNPYFCKNNCESCGYCENYIKKCIEIDKVDETNAIAREFYKSYDSFTKLVQTVNIENNERKSQEPIKKLFQENDLDIDIDL